MRLPYAPRGVEDEECGNSACAQVGECSPLGIVRRQEAVVLEPLREVATCVVRIPVDAHDQNPNSGADGGFSQGFERPQLAFTWRAPGRPEIDDERLPPQIGEQEGAAVESLHLELDRRLRCDGQRR